MVSNQHLTCHPTVVVHMVPALQRAEHSHTRLAGAPQRWFIPTLMMYLLEKAVLQQRVIRPVQPVPQVRDGHLQLRRSRCQSRADSFHPLPDRDVCQGCQLGHALQVAFGSQRSGKLATDLTSSPAEMFLKAVIDTWLLSSARPTYAFANPGSSWFASSAVNQ